MNQKTNVLNKIELLLYKLLVLKIVLHIIFLLNLLIFENGLKT